VPRTTIKPHPAGKAQSVDDRSHPQKPRTATVITSTLQGNIALRKQIAKNAFNWGGNITEDDVVTTQGCMEALIFCLRAVTKPGDTVAIESPTYFGIFNVMLSLDLKVLEIPVVAGNRVWTLNI
jgi:DNA-binding transcriptional MocR family regulator